MPQVLIVDDDEGTLETFEAIVRLSGFEAYCTKTGHDGLEKARRTKPDLVLADLRLPDCSGVDLLRMLRSEQIETVFVIMTAFGSVASAVDAMKLGAYDYVEKPLADADLTALIQRAVSCLTSHLAALDATQNGSTSSIDDGPHNPRAGSIQRRTTEAIRRMETQYSDPNLCLRNVARQLDISPEHLCRLLKRDTGRGFTFHLHRIRTLEAQRLLRETDLSVKEIAYRTGYETTVRLDRCFRRVCKVSPTEYKRSG